MRKRVLVVQPTLSPHGGGGGVCAWILEALRDGYDVSLLSWRRPDLAAVNRFYGTALTDDTVRLEEALPALPASVRPPPVLRRLAQYALLAAARRRRRDVDLVISAEEESDLGGGGLQYVHFPWHRPTRGATRLYHRVAETLTGTSPARMRSNVTVVNSDWTGALVRDLHGIDTVTIHPPAAGRFPDVPWAARADGFVACGRAAREKRYELVIAILDAVRARGHDVRLHLVLTHNSPNYEREIRRLASARADWITVHAGLSRAELAALMAANRYGIHGMANEHYGMAIAEMVVAGAIPFVPRGGGQVEIVRDDRLTFADADEAVAKICAVLDDAAARDDLRARLAERRADLGPERFVREIRALVDRMARA